MNELTALVVFVSLTYAVVQFFKSLKTQEFDTAVSQLISWGAGIGITLLAAQTSFASGIPTIGESNLAFATFWDQIFFGLGVASTANAAFDFSKRTLGGSAGTILNFSASGAGAKAGPEVLSADGVAGAVKDAIREALNEPVTVTTAEGRHIAETEEGIRKDLGEG